MLLASPSRHSGTLREEKTGEGPELPTLRHASMYPPLENQSFWYVMDGKILPARDLFEERKLGLWVMLLLVWKERIFLIIGHQEIPRIGSVVFGSWSRTPYLVEGSRNVIRFFFFLVNFNFFFTEITACSNFFVHFQAQIIVNLNNFFTKIS